jgi:hypothetical protein
MNVEINGIVYTVETGGRAKAVRRAAELAAKKSNAPGNAGIPKFRGYEPRGVVYLVNVAGITYVAIVRNSGE